MSKVLIITTSLRARSNSDILAERVAAGARDAGLPDVTVFDGAHRKILIDAKVNIVDFIAATNAARAGDAAEASRLMCEHAKRVRAQVDHLRRGGSAGEAHQCFRLIL